MVVADSCSEWSGNSGSLKPEGPALLRLKALMLQLQSLQYILFLHLHLPLNHHLLQQCAAHLFAEHQINFLSCRAVGRSSSCYLGLHRDL